jgi:tRNA A-37 threonylcarbamoyl transferase component Bud32
VSQATGYLHARGIVHGKLNPHNIFLEGDNYRVKLSLLDHALADDSASSQLQ